MRTRRRLRRLGVRKRFKSGHIKDYLANERAKRSAPPKPRAAELPPVELAPPKPDEGC